MAITDIQATVLANTGNTPTATSVADAQKFVVSSIPKDLLKWAGRETVAATHGGDDSPTDITIPVGTDNILFVQRDGYHAAESPISDRAFLETTSGSLKIPTASFPKYYITAGNKIIVKPNPTDALTARVTYVDFSKLDDNSDLRNAVVFHATSSEFTKLSSAQLPTSAISFNSVPPDTPSSKSKVPFWIPSFPRSRAILITRICSIFSPPVRSPSLSKLSIDPVWSNPTRTCAISL